MFFALQATLDPVGNISLVLQIVILFLLILGLPRVRGPSNANLLWHGYSTLAALVLHTILIFLIMVPTLTDGLGEIAELSSLSAFTVWSHAVLGTAAEVFAIILVVAWLVPGPKRMACARKKKWMLPIFIVWVISVVNGTIVHVLGLI